MMVPFRRTARCKGVSFCNVIVCARLIVICRIGAENSPEVRFAKDQHLVEALAAQGADQTRRDPIFPR